MFKQKEKASKKNRLLSDEEEEIIIQLAIQQREAHLSVSQLWTRERISEITEGRVPNVSSSFIKTKIKN
jgi:hypothetical protein